MKMVYSFRVGDALPETGDDFFHCHPIRLVRSAIGNYIEAEGTPLSRFGWRIPIAHPGRPHLLKVTYPDDRRRFMTVGDGTTYDASFGIVTGFRWPLSGDMQCAELYFWPRFADFSLCFMTWGHDEPAAIGSLEIYELDETEMPAFAPQIPGGRNFGIHYEDPCGTQASEGAHNFDEWQEHLFTYLRFTGQNTLVYPICWYHGPHYPGTSDGAQCFGWSVEDDRRQYKIYHVSPKDWVADLLKRCEKEKVAFWGAFTLLRLKSLMEKLKTRPDLLSVNDNNIVQRGTQDWTWLYHVSNYPKKLNGTLDELAYGEEKYVPDCPRGPIFNPMHPEVQACIIRFFRETCQCYRDYPAFKGISLNFWGPTMVWFGSLRSGYDDYTTRLFEQETAVHIPVDPVAPDRFAKRAEWLLKHCRGEWIAWRCKKVAELLRTIRDEMVKVRPDLVLSLTMWYETYMPAVCAFGTEEAQYGTRESNVQIFRNAGFDPALFADEANMEIVYQMEGGNRDRSESNKEEYNRAAFYMYRDFDYLDNSQWDLLRQSRSPGVFVFNAWHEAWGDHRWFPAEPGLPDKTLYGKTTPNFFRYNSYYEPDGFWFDSQIRITPAFPSGRYYLEHLTHALAKSDALKITAGGLFVDKLHAGLFREFSNVFCRLPREKFGDVGTSADPVTVRQLKTENGYCIYAVNREPYDVRIQWRSAAPLNGRSVDDTADFDPEGVILGPFALQAWNVDAPLDDFCCTIPEEIRRSLTGQAEAALAGDLPEMIRKDLTESLAACRYSRLRHLLTSYPVHRSIR